MGKIKSLHIENVRAIKSATINFADGLTVLIGENGAGKSTILECLELLRKIPSGRFVEDLYEQHGGVAGLLRKGETTMRLKVEVEVNGFDVTEVYSYDLILRERGGQLVIVKECILEGNDIRMLRRDGMFSYDDWRGETTDVEADTLNTNELVITSFGKHPPNTAITEILNTLGKIEVQLRFETLARWAAIATAQQSPLRGSAMVRPTGRVDLLGRNLAAAWNVLMNERSSEDVDYALNLVRMGLGEDVDRVNIVSDPSGGQVGLALRRRGVPDAIPASMLSDGQLAWLAFVAMVRLNEGRSILAVDEPELHMHPYLVNAVVALLQTVEAPVVIATHSDHILSLLDDPVAAVRVCSLEQGAAVVRELDQATFDRWRERYTDLGQLRASGFLDRVLKADSRGD